MVRHLMLLAYCNAAQLVCEGAEQLRSKLVQNQHSVSLLTVESGFPAPLQGQIRSNVNGVQRLRELVNRQVANRPISITESDAIARALRELDRALRELDEVCPPLLSKSHAVAALLGAASGAFAASKLAKPSARNLVTGAGIGGLFLGAGSLARNWRLRNRLVQAPA